MRWLIWTKILYGFSNDVIGINGQFVNEKNWCDITGILLNQINIIRNNYNFIKENKSMYNLWFWKWVTLCKNISNKGSETYKRGEII